LYELFMNANPPWIFDCFLLENGAVVA